MSKSIKITIDETGNASIEAEGFTDGSCLKETEALEAALGGNIDKRKLKATAYKTTVMPGTDIKTK